MDFNNGLYVFNGVPGLEASKGERITEGLRKLSIKIKRLEQVRNSEKEISSKGGSTDTEEFTLQDVKQQFLAIQIRYLRLMLRNSRNDGTKSAASKSEHHPEQSETEHTKIQNCCKETQTGMSLHEIMPHSTASHIDETCDHIPSESTMHVQESAASNSDAINNKNQLTSESAQSSKDIPFRYHLNIDAPFILGTSAFESHNLIANIQDLISKMKCHHKSLCGSRFQASQNRQNSQEIKKSQERILKEISKSLTAIQINQAQLIERLDNQNSDHLTGDEIKDISHYETDIHQKQYKDISHYGKDIKQKESKKLFPNASSTLTDTTAAVRLKARKQPRSTKTVKKNKHVVPTNKIQINVPHVARQRLLRSIREVKTHLSEEDISWV